MIGRREGAIALLVGVLAVAALAGTYGAPAPDAPGAGNGSGAGGSTPIDAEAPGGGGPPLTLPGWTVRTVVVATAGFGTVFTALAAVGVLWLHGVAGLKRMVRLVAEVLGGVVLYVLLIGFLIWVVFGFTGEGIEPPPQPTGEGGGGPSGGTGGETGENDASAQSWLLAAGVLGALALVAVAVARYLRTEAESAFEFDGTDEDVDGAQSATVAPPVDDPEPIGDVPPSNGVFRAWRRMADVVEEATDRTLTTGEVASAAVERGLDREAVGTLTTLFEEVRYGDRPATADREGRAEAAVSDLSLDGGDEE